VIDLATKEVEIKMPSGTVFRIKRGSRVRYIKDKHSLKPSIVERIDVNFREGEEPDVDIRKPDGNVVNTTIKNLLPYFDESRESELDEEKEDELSAEFWSPQEDEELNFRHNPEREEPEDDDEWMIVDSEANEPDESNDEESVIVQQDRDVPVQEDRKSPTVDTWSSKQDLQTTPCLPHSPFEYPRADDENDGSPFDEVEVEPVPAPAPKSTHLEIPRLDPDGYSSVNDHRLSSEWKRTELAPPMNLPERPSWGFDVPRAQRVPSHNRIPSAASVYGQLSRSRPRCNPWWMTLSESSQEDLWGHHPSARQIVVNPLGGAFPSTGHSRRSLSPTRYSGGFGLFDLF